MPSGPRIRTDNVYGTLTDNPLTSGATTMNSAGLANLAAVASAHAIIILDPLRTAGAPEAVIVTAHTGSATSATITRAAYGTAARQHASGTLWVHAPTIEDFIRIVTASTRPTDPYEGQLIYETDTDRYQTYTGSAWRQPHNPPCCRVYKSTAQALTTGMNTAILFDTERYDTDAMHSTSSLTTRITFTTAGVYVVGGNVEFASSATGAYRQLGVRLNGTTFIAWALQHPANITNKLAVVTTYKFAAADYVELMAEHSHGSNLNVSAIPNYSPEFFATWVAVG